MTLNYSTFGAIILSHAATESGILYDIIVKFDF